MSEESAKYTDADWQLMKEQVDGFWKVLVKTKRVPRRAGYSVFAYGTPFNFTVVVEWTVNRVRFRKLFCRDIRAGSCQFWVEQWDAINPTLIN